ncbi:hypothetical protein CC86DRAFT_385160 [Ophiobolus disseminans]|uniref:Uncharacterized protein n=1 Tax=Ophiobolus disseminans TaxID=1469910 RepID=A0A6A6ZQE0_9PLEO|nr:hypothetical protein CC86DRAFT_385160 [Ophiobolus disseminans]
MQSVSTQCIRSWIPDNTSPKTMNFFQFPAEIRVRIYEEIIGGAAAPPMKARGSATHLGTYRDLFTIDTAPPTAAALRSFSGFLLSNREIYTEFEYKAIKSIKVFLHQELQREWLRLEPTIPPIPPSPRGMCDTINMEIGIPREYYRRFQDSDLEDGRQHQIILFQLLLDSLASFSLYPWSETKVENVTLQKNSEYIYRFSGLILKWRGAKCTMRGQADVKGIGRLEMNESTLLVAWDANWDPAKAWKRAKGWSQSPVLINLHRAIEKGKSNA